MPSNPHSSSVMAALLASFSSGKSAMTEPSPPAPENFAPSAPISESWAHVWVRLGALMAGRCAASVVVGTLAVPHCFTQDIRHAIARLAGTDLSKRN